VSEGHAQGPYVATRVGFEPATFRTQGTEPTTGIGSTVGCSHNRQLGQSGKCAIDKA